MSYCVYLRKSRADNELEHEGVNETLRRHKSALLKFADDNGLPVTKIHEEIASGESIAHRPEMLEMLDEVSQGKYRGVIVMDVDRLGRGNMREQGMILETFKASGTMIITPRKTYDLDNEFDEEYSEFAAFMARKELKLINRRLKQGRLKSVEEGNYIAPLPPYGYSIVKNNGKRTLTPEPEQAPVVKLIFELYVNGAIGSKKIAARLNEIGLKTYTGKLWDGCSVLTILKNGVYAGKIEWRKKIYTKSSELGKRKVTTNDSANRMTVDGAHEAIISAELFEGAQAKLASRRCPPYKTKLVNPFAGLIFCKRCGTPMIYRHYSGKPPRLLCHKSCGTKSTAFALVEQRIVTSMEELFNYQINLEKGLTCDRKDEIRSRYKALLTHLRKEQSLSEGKKEALHGLLERGIYSEDTFTARMDKLKEEVLKLEKGIEIILEALKAPEHNGDSKDAAAGFDNILDIYSLLNTPELKNRLLKSFIIKIEYDMPKSRKTGDFDLTIFAKI